MPDEPNPGTGGAGDGGTPTDKPAVPAIDLKSPEIQAAIQRAADSAAAAAVTAKAQEWEAEKERILKHKDEILTEKKKADERLAAIETELQVKGLGADPKKVEELIEQKAGVKYEARRKELDDLVLAKDNKIAELEGQTKAVAGQNHELFVLNQLYQASIPEETRFIHDAAMPFLTATLKELMVMHEVPGLGKVGRFKKGGTFLTGSGPDGLMDTREFLDMARQGKLKDMGLPDLSFCFISAGRGSNTTENTGAGDTPIDVDWSVLSPAEKVKYESKYGLEAAQRQIDRASKKRFENSKRVA